MSNYLCKPNILLATLTLAFSSAAMSFDPPTSYFNNEWQEAQRNTQKTLEKEEIIAAVEPAPIVLPDELNKIRGSLETGQDAQYYSFTAVRGQNVMVRELRYNEQQSPWKIEYKIDQEWEVVPPGKSKTIKALPLQQQVQVRISNDPSKIVPPGTPYELEIGSAPYLRNHKVKGDADRYAIHFMTAKFINSVDFFTQVRDSKGHPIKEATIDLVMNLDDDSPYGEKIFKLISNQGGAITTTLSLPACIGRYKTEPFVGVWDFKTQWQVTYNTGFYYISPQGNEEGGVGIKGGSKVPLVHICSQKIVGLR